ncbi:hypothetical protein AB3329_10315 [Streptococcus sp. H31]|uniref:DUF7916 family protein n=1 Tax=Streptococcus huangxiaojuni TaxID=3237239 RepID=UPI0034A39D47
MNSVTRLISATGSDFKKFSPMDLKESIRKSEGRVIMGQHLLFDSKGLVRGVTNSEVMFAFGADMVMLNTMDLDVESHNLGLQGLSYQELKQRCKRPIGIYMGCPKKGFSTADKNKLYRVEGMLCTPNHVEKCVQMGVDFIVLGGNPGSGTSIKDVVDCTRWIKEKYGNQLFVFAGKWEDGTTEPVLGDSLANFQGRDDKEIIKKLIDAGADCIDLPAPGSRQGISVEHIQELVQFIHTYKSGTLAMVFLNSSVEGSDSDTVRLIALKMKETGADIHAIGDGGFSGCSSPENIYQLSVSIKGRPYTYFRMASVNK